MKVLVNGLTVGEHLRVLKNREDERVIYKNTERLINHIKKHKWLYARLVVMLAITLFTGAFNIDPVFAADVDKMVSKVNELGNTLLKLAQVIGYWIVLLITLKDAIGEALRGNRQEIGNIVIKGVLLMATIYYLPVLFDFMKELTLD
ncbi:MAG: hypothetical protein ACRCX2_35955 [Paraclostridium sp.]